MSHPINFQDAREEGGDSWERARIFDRQRSRGSRGTNGAYISLTVTTPTLSRYGTRAGPTSGSATAQGLIGGIGQRS